MLWHRQQTAAPGWIDRQHSQNISHDIFNPHIFTYGHPNDLIPLSFCGMSQPKRGDVFTVKPRVKARVGEKRDHDDDSNLDVINLPLIETKKVIVKSKGVTERIKKKVLQCLDDGKSLRATSNESGVSVGKLRNLLKLRANSINPSYVQPQRGRKPYLSHESVELAILSNNNALTKASADKQHVQEVIISSHKKQLISEGKANQHSILAPMSKPTLNKYTKQIFPEVVKEAAVINGRRAEV